ncbi:SAM-dependent methyltransferase [Pseudodesulfovibrio sp. S3]|nr:SAM-dependent methyltransferase [Pseudodesulfovibrio sp. S3]
MKQDTPSLTAYRVALMRAAHQIYDNPTVFEDPVALAIIGPHGAAELRSKKRQLRTRLHSNLRAIVVARSRLAEDALSEAVKCGVRQYVILGAGLDTFAYRNPYSALGLNIFEVDHPDTQEWKIKQLKAAAISIPENLTFTPVDFAKQSLAGPLQKSGFDTNQPTFFSWLGVTMYLPAASMLKTLQYIASSTPSGSEVIFDYIIPPSSQGILRRVVFSLLSKKVGRAGEPWISFYDPDALKTELKALGFTQLTDFGPEELNSLFFKDRKDALRIGSFGHVMKAHS